MGKDMECKKESKNMLLNTRVSLKMFIIKICDTRHRVPKCVTIEAKNFNLGLESATMWLKIFIFLT